MKITEFYKYRGSAKGQIIPVIRQSCGMVNDVSHYGAKKLGAKTTGKKEPG